MPQCANPVRLFLSVYVCSLKYTVEWGVTIFCRSSRNRDESRVGEREGLSRTILDLLVSSPGISRQNESSVRAVSDIDSLVVVLIDEYRSKQKCAIGDICPVSPLMEHTDKLVLSLWREKYSRSFAIGFSTLNFRLWRGFDADRIIAISRQFKESETILTTSAYPLIMADRSVPV